MHTEIQGICLRVVKYSDSMSIATLWTRQLGRLSVTMPSGASREARRRKALMMPLGCIEATATLRADRDIASLGDVRPYLCGDPAGGDPMKNLVGMFMADFLGAVLRESQPDELLTDFLFGAACLLREVGGTALANFPIYFMYALGHFLGISPDTGSYRRGYAFDMCEGIFSATPSMHTQWLSPADARMVWILSRLTPRSLALLRLSQTERNRILDTILRYYTLHHTPVTNLPSLSILRTILG